MWAGWHFARRAWRSLAAARYARRAGVLGGEFDSFGRWLGTRLALRGDRVGVDYLLAPVSSVRYFEFPFVRDCLPSPTSRALDVASPRLFSLFAVHHGLCQAVDVINPDAVDLATTSRIVAAMGLEERITCRAVDARSLSSVDDRYDAVWSISVLEHISGAYEDRQAIRWMFEAVKPGGRLVVTVPVDRRESIECRSEDPYGMQRPGPDGRYFFQRFYDASAIEGRLTASLGVRPDGVRWYGERVQGFFRAYEARWMAAGPDCVVDDARTFAEHFTEYPDWDSMPGLGVCGLCYTRPGSGGVTG